MNYGCFVPAWAVVLKVGLVKRLRYIYFIWLMLFVFQRDLQSRQDTIKVKALAQGPKCIGLVVLGFELVTFKSRSPMPSPLSHHFLKHSQRVCDVFKNFFTVLFFTTHCYPYYKLLYLLSDSY